MRNRAAQDLKIREAAVYNLIPCYDGGYYFVRETPHGPWPLFKFYNRSFWQEFVDEVTRLNVELEETEGPELKVADVLQEAKEILGEQPPTATA